MLFAVLVTDAAEYRLLNNLLDRVAIGSGTAEMIAISHFVPSWVLKVKSSHSSSTLASEVMMVFETHFRKVDFVVSEEDVCQVRNLVNTIEPMSHHLLPGLVVTCEPTNARQICARLKPFPMLETCLPLLKHMQAPPCMFHLPLNQQYLYAHYRNNPDNRVKKTDEYNLSETNTNTELLVVVMHLPRTAVTFLIGGKGHSINKIRQQTTATIKIHSEIVNDVASDSSEASMRELDQFQRVDIVASTEDELTRAQQLVLQRLSLRQE